ncbi:MAG: hypothetical protein ACFFDH_13995 [Promethearchaeota archaeon]
MFNQGLADNILEILKTEEIMRVPDIMRNYYLYDALLGYKRMIDD